MEGKSNWWQQCNRARDPKTLYSISRNAQCFIRVQLLFVFRLLLLLLLLLPPPPPLYIQWAARFISFQTNMQVHIIYISYLLIESKCNCQLLYQISRYSLLLELSDWSALSLASWIVISFFDFTTIYGISTWPVDPLHFFLSFSFLLHF